MSDKWNVITEEMRKARYPEIPNGFPLPYTVVWITWNGATVMGYIRHAEDEYFPERRCGCWNWYKEDGTRLGSIINRSIEAWMYIEKPKPYKSKIREYEE